MAPVDTSPASNMCGFELIASLKSNDIIPVHQYKSTNTGLTVFIADVDGPVVYGHFALATEAHDDDGLPHTLEHLIFLGSENYPYKGILDLLANRCLAYGTNAQTDRDNTYYTLVTAGSEGFLNLMPIYLDHILYPLLKESGFITEVHHVTPEGDDAGIAYCEKQSHERNAETLLYIELVRKVYPGKCGYKSVTGGALKNFQESTTNAKVKEYHKQFYRPENLFVIITGHVNHADVFKALKPIEDKIISRGNRSPFKRPWQDPVPPMTESVDISVKYPSDEEDYGLVYVGWQGPSVVDNYYDFKGCSILLTYLTKTAVSPLRQEFTEIEVPLASSVHLGISENSISLLLLAFNNVPIAKLSQIKPRMINLLRSIASKPNGIDMKRMHSVINRCILEILSHLETVPNDTVAYMIIAHALYGNTKEDLNIRLNEIEILKKLLNEPSTYWTNLLQKYLVDNPMVTARGVPSIERKNELAEQEEERVKKQIETLGEKGLEQKRQELEEAVKENERPIPPECLSSVPIPSIDSISYHNIKSFSTGSSEQHPKFDANKLPFYTFLDQVNTNFVYLVAAMDTSDLPCNHRYYLPLLLEYLLESPVRRNGELIPYEEVVSSLESDTVAAATRLGHMSLSKFNCGAFNYTANFLLQAEFGKYDKAVQWLKEILFNTEFKADRLNVIASKMINDVAKMKRKEDFVCKDLMKGLIYNDESNHYAVNMLRQHKFLTKLLEKLSTSEGQKKVIADLESVRTTLTSSENLAIYMATNVDRLSMHSSNLYTPWEKHFDIKKSSTPKKRISITPDYKLLKEPLDIPIKGCITGVGSTESFYLQQSVPCISDYEHPDLAPLLVCLQYLKQMEGPMWKQIRGQGLSYNYSLMLNVNEGRLYLSFSYATLLVESYRQAKIIIETILKEKKWDTLLFESGKSSFIYNVISREQSVRDLVEQALLSHFQNVSYDYNRQLVTRANAVTIQDMDRIAQKYLAPLYDPEMSRITVVCPSEKTNEVAKGMKEFGHDLIIYNNLQETYLNDVKF